MTNATRTIVRRAAGLALAVVALNACKDTAVPATICEGRLSGHEPSLSKTPRKLPS